MNPLKRKPRSQETGGDLRGPPGLHHSARESRERETKKAGAVEGGEEEQKTLEGN